MKEKRKFAYKIKIIQIKINATDIMMTSDEGNDSAAPVDFN